MRQIIVDGGLGLLACAAVALCAAAFVVSAPGYIEQNQIGFIPDAVIESSPDAGRVVLSDHWRTPYAFPHNNHSTSFVGANLIRVAKEGL